MNSRGTVVGIVAKWLKTGAFPDREVAKVRNARAFVTEVVYGTVKRKRALDWIIGQCASQHSASDRTIPYLMTGLYQLLFMSDIEPYAAVNETVEACKERLPRGGIKFVNAILRRATREKDQLLSGLADQKVGIRESHPDELVKKWAERYGEADAERLCKWNNDRAHVTIRINMLKTSMTEYLLLAQEAEIQLEPHSFAPDRCLIVPRGCKVTNLPGYADGLFTVQDASMIVPTDLLGVEPGLDILDACAAPGGKTMQLVEALRGEGSITAMDMHEDRLIRLRENLRRTGAEDDVSVVKGDAAKAVEILGEKRFDRILVDVPCTNTGVLQRRADARWRFDGKRLERMGKVQASILDGVAPLLRQGGILVYSTCSLENEECGGLVTDWLGRNPEFELISDKSLFPPDSGTDGIYAAALKRKTA
jgi:16S rRNA (cytosine967-C5)-methyltransferase